MNNHQKTAPDCQALIANVFDMISLPEVYLRIRGLMDDKNSRIKNFAEVVQIDPNLAAKVLKIVNSAYYGFSGKIESISRALNLMGLGQLHNLVLGVSAMNSFSGMSSDLIDMRMFWLRNLYCGVLSRLLAQACKLRDSEKLYVIGLLHEIGHLILFEAFPDESTEAISKAEQQQRPLFQIERELIGLDYAQVGQQLMQAWKLPDDFQEITACHTEPETAQHYALEASIVHIAHIFSETANSASDPQHRVEKVDPFAWETTGLRYEDIAPLLGEGIRQSAELTKLVL